MFLPPPQIYWGNIYSKPMNTLNALNISAKFKLRLPTIVLYLLHGLHTTNSRGIESNPT